MNELLPLIVPSAISLAGVIIGALYLRKSQREKNQIDADSADASAFKIVTDQLFELNRVHNERIEALEARINALELDNKQLVSELEDTDRKWQSQIGITRQLANYIKRLIAHWPKEAAPPPAPEPPIDWVLHLGHS